MDITTIKDMMTVILFLISVYGWWKSANKDSVKQVEQFTKLNWKMDTMCQSQNDIKDDVRALKKSNYDTDRMITIINEQIKAINKRIDDLEEK